MNINKLWKNAYSYVVILAILVVVPLFLGNHPVSILIYFLTYTALALSLYLMMSAGLLSLGHAAFWGIGAYTSALLVSKLGFNFWLALPLSGVVSGLLAVIIGYPLLRIKGIYFAIGTFCLAEIVRLILGFWQGLTGGHMGIVNLPGPSIMGVEFSDRKAYYYLILILAVVIAIFVYRILKSNTGRAARCIAENDKLSESIGIDLLGTKLLVFSISCFLAGIVGSFQAHYFHFVIPDMFGVWQSIMILVCVQIGGMGSLLGPIIGAVLLTLINEYLGFVWGGPQFVLGLTFMLIVLFLPNGLLDLKRFVIPKNVGRKYGAAGNN